MANAERRLALKAMLPDVPRYVETRSALRDERAEVLFFEVGPPVRALVRYEAAHLVSVIGPVEASSLLSAVERPRAEIEIIADVSQEETIRELLPKWEIERGIFHTLPVGRSMPDVSDGDVRWLEAREWDHPGVAGELRQELEDAEARTRIAASFVNGVAVSFCYSGAETEQYWDVSIDTLEEYRRQGHARRTAVFAMHSYVEQGLRPVWGALVANEASWRLAQSLGFKVVDEILVAEPSD